jgi:hypothetical protein
MRIWFAVCTGLSLLLLTTLVLSMTTCTRDFEIGPQGSLIEVTKVEYEGKPPEVQRKVRVWDADMPEFRDLASRVLPGDRLTHTQNIVGFPLFKLAMTRLEVFRKDVRVLVVRDGALRFWAVIVGISVFPLLCWAGGALWTISSRPRPQPL